MIGTSPPAPQSVYIAFEVFPRPKGASSHIYSMVKALEKSHGPVLLLCLGTSQMPSWQQEDGIVIRRYRGRHANMLRRASGFGEFVDRALRDNLHGVKLCVFRDPWGGYPALAHRKAFATLFEVNALPSWELPYAYPRMRRNRALLEKMRDTELYCLQCSEAITTVSTVTAEALARLDVPRGRITVIPNAALPVFFEAGRGGGGLPGSGLLGAGRWFGYFGSTHPWQGIEVAIDAFSLVAEDLPDLNLLLIAAGRKQRRKALRKRVAKRGLAGRVAVRRALPPEELAPVVAALEFTLAPLLETGRNTLQGCCPIKVIESMAAGTPVVASDLRVVRALLSPGEGLLVSPGDPRALALAVRRLARDHALARRLGRAASRRARSNFTWDVIHAKLQACFERVGGGEHEQDERGCDQIERRGKEGRGPGGDLRKETAP